MGKYIVRRLLLIIPTFLGITLMVFAITRFVPGGPIERMMNEAQMAKQGRIGGVDDAAPLSEEQIKELEAYYGFDKPVIVAYTNWLVKVLKLDLGLSSRYSEPVWEIIKDRLPVSIFYGVMTMFITYLVCIPLGVLKSIKHNSFFDNLSSIVVFVGYAVPGYVVGIFLLVIFGSELEWFPMEGFYGDGFEDLSLMGKVGDIFYHATLPLIAYLAGSFAVMTFLMKNSLMDNLASDYVRTALAKGLSFPKAVLNHAMRNSLIPMATHFGNNLSVILTGSFLIETIFNIDGMGLLGFESIVQRDYPVVMGILVISSLLFLIGNIISDICVALVDPRVRFQ